MKLAHCDDAVCGAPPAIRTIDNAAAVGRGSSLRLDSSGKPVISYPDSTNGDLKVAHCADVNCVSATINSLDAANNVGADTSLALDSSGRPVISYADEGIDSRM